MSADDGRLACVRDALGYQREWFGAMRDRAARGEPLALVNADAPQEIFRAMGVDYVVNQWWASIIGAKQRSAAHLERLRARGYPDRSEQYNALGLASVLDPDPDGGPWGGLPRPSLVVAENSGDTLRKVFDLWQLELDVPFYPLESAAEDTVPVNWWDLMPDRWEQCIGPARIDLLVGELLGLVRHLETLTGRPLEKSRLREVMALSNEQAEWNRRTRDLIARTRPCPIPVNDVIPGVMVPQWHRGTEWARDMARRLHDEVAARVDAGHAVATDERLRLMWIGRGVWHDMSLYRRFEQSHGAVFVWSMYLALAADAYARYGPDPLRAVAARFCAFHDQMYTPPWSGEWYVKEARRHGVDGVVHLVSADSRNGWAATHALRTAGVPVLEIRMDNSDARAYDAAAVEAEVSQWLDGLRPPGIAAAAKGALPC